MLDREIEKKIVEAVAHGRNYRLTKESVVTRVEDILQKTRNLVEMRKQLREAIWDERRGNDVKKAAEAIVQYFRREDKA